MAHQRILPGISPARQKEGPSAESLSDVVFGGVAETPLLSLTLSIKHPTKNAYVEVRLVYDPESRKLIKIQQGKGSRWKDMDVRRRKAQRIMLVARRRFETHIERKAERKALEERQPSLFTS